MRKLKSKRIGNYLLKGLLLCALVVGGWFTADIGAKAESVAHSVEFKSEESQIVQFERTDGLEQHIEVTNNESNIFAQYSYAELPYEIMDRRS